jgi:hypothetical protein
VQLILANRNPFDCPDRATINLRDRHEATINDRAIDHHRTRAALAFAAAFFRAGQMKLFAQHVEQTLHGISVKRSLFFIDRAIDFYLV